MIFFFMDYAFAAATYTAPASVRVGNAGADHDLADLLSSCGGVRTLSTWHDVRSSLDELKRPVLIFGSPAGFSSFRSLDLPLPGVGIVLIGGSEELADADTGGADLVITIPPNVRARAALTSLRKRIEFEAAAVEAARAGTNALEALAHDLRTPATAIAGYAELLQLEAPSGQHETIRRIVKNARIVEDLCGNLTALARERDRLVPLHPAVVNARDLLEDAVNTVDPGCADRGVQTQLDMASDLPLLWVDRVAVRRVLVNVLDNAARVSPGGTTIRIEVTRAGDSVRFRVMDRGPGLAPELLSRIFVRRQSGTGRSGLGLAIAWDLVTLHGGAIWAENRPAGGAVITIVLPSVLRDFTAFRSPHGHVTLRPEQGGLRITFAGALGEEDSRLLRANLLAATAEADRILLDLRPCRRLASRVLAVLFELFLQSEQRVRPFRILGISEELEPIVQAAGLAIVGGESDHRGDTV